MKDCKHEMAKPSDNVKNALKARKTEASQGSNVKKTPKDYK